MSKKTVIANIGLMTGAKYGAVKEFSAEQALDCMGYFFNGCHGWEGEVQALKVARSASEDTLVATVLIDSEAVCDKMNPHVNNAFYMLAKALKQEAIAYYVVEEQQGYLVGEYAEEWGGEFKPEYFLI